MNGEADLFVLDPGARRPDGALRRPRHLAQGRYVGGGGGLDASLALDQPLRAVIAGVDGGVQPDHRTGVRDAPSGEDDDVNAPGERGEGVPRFGEHGGGGRLRGDGGYRAVYVGKEGGGSAPQEREGVGAALPEVGQAAHEPPSPGGAAPGGVGAS